jgi:hypothetical protein
MMRDGPNADWIDFYHRKWWQSRPNIADREIGGRRPCFVLRWGERGALVAVR